MKTYFRFALTSLIILTLLAFPTPAKASVLSIDLGTLGGESSTALGINNYDQVVGFSRNSDGYEHAFLWENGVMTDLGTLTSYGTSNAFAINDSGWVVGRSYTERGFDHAFLWIDGIMTDLDTLGGNQSYATDVNNQGQIVGGASAENGGTRAFLWQNEAMLDMGTLGGSGSFANSINELGQVVGAADTESGERHAFLWDNGVMTDLGTLGGSSEAIGINDAGQIVGWSQTANGTWHAFLWENGVMTDLTPFENFGQGTGINQLGVIGITTDGLGRLHYQQQEIALSPITGMFSNVFALNDQCHAAGNSAAEGGSEHAILWKMPCSAFTPNQITVGSINFPEGPIKVSESLDISVDFQDSDPNEIHTVLVYWGDETIDYGTVVESNGSGIVYASHIYSESRLYEIRMYVQDSHGDAAGTPNAAYSIEPLIPRNEIGTSQVSTPVQPAPAGTLLEFGFSFSDTDPTQVHTAYWDWGDGTTSEGVIDEYEGNGSVAGFHAYDLAGTYFVSGNISDREGDVFGTATYFTVVPAPIPNEITLETPTATGSGVINSPITTTVNFQDSDPSENHTAVWDWGDGTTSAGLIVENNGSGTVTGNHTYSASATYLIQLQVMDSDGDEATTTLTYSVTPATVPALVRGAGWFNSPKGAYPADLSLAGKVIFGFSNMNNHNGSASQGEVLVYFSRARLTFWSEASQWIKVNEDLAILTGTGSLNGEDGYNFLIMVEDCQLSGCGKDKIRMKIWQQDGSELQVIYDSQPGAADGAFPKIGILGGAIQIK